MSNPGRRRRPHRRIVASCRCTDQADRAGRRSSRSSCIARPSLARARGQQFHAGGGCRLKSSPRGAAASTDEEHEHAPSRAREMRASTVNAGRVRVGLLLQRQRPRARGIRARVRRPSAAAPKRKRAAAKTPSCASAHPSHSGRRGIFASRGGRKEAAAHAAERKPRRMGPLSAMLPQIFL